ncbi:hypothetical protein ACJ2A9_02315 [Anaerobacillus sp. MEB173]
MSIVDLKESKTPSTIQLNSEQLSHGIAQSPNGDILYVGTDLMRKVY